MRTRLALVSAALLCLSGMLTPIADAISLNIEIGDRPYYIHGPGYWVGGVYWVWIPGHWDGWRHGHRIWVHGHYARR
jgi:hypothetical protein